MAQVIQRPGDPSRELAFECVGDPSGIPVFLLHGMPGSRSGPRPRESVLYRLGVRLICYDRPGYGESTRHEGRSVADAVGDVRAIADHLKLGTFSVVGRSGGAPCALACAALLGDQVSCVAALVGLAPPDAPGLNWYEGMTDSNTNSYRGVEEDREAIIAAVEQRAALIARDKTVLLNQLRPELTGPDRWIVNEVAIQGVLSDPHAEAVRQGPWGWIDDALALRSPWQFDLATIDVPVLIWHGKDDVFSPASHAQWLAEHIRAGRDEAQVEIVIKPGAAHFDAVPVLPEVLSWIKRRHQQRTSPAVSTAGAAASERLRVDRTHQPAFPA